MAEKRMTFMSNVSVLMSKPRGAIASLFMVLMVSGPVWGEQTIEVVVQDYSFQPAVVTIKAGGTVIWVNKEKRTSHSVVLPAAQGGESERFFPDESWTYRFEKPGIYPYHCGPHPEMVGTITVIAP